MLEKTLESLSSNPQINIKYNTRFEAGYFGYSQSQFKMDASIEFKDSNDEVWLIKTTSSIRSDRVKGNQFDAQNIKDIKPNVKKIYLVTSDFADSEEIKKRKNYSEAIRKKKLFSLIDDVISINALSLLIRDKALENLSQGVRSNIIGKESEERIMKALNNEVNIELWNKTDTDSKSADYELFEEILSTYGIDNKTEKIIGLFATTEIPLLDGGGQAKTDVNCEIETNKSIYKINISVKETSAKQVSIHEGFMENLLIALDLDHDSDLGIALMRLQECGGKISLLKKYPGDNSTLEKELPKYNNQLIKFFFFGIGSDQKDIQIANMLVYNKIFKAMTIDDTIDHLSKHRGQFGTSFSFTYPSGGKGKKITVKAPTNN